MEENLSRMSELLKKKAVEQGKPIEDFTAIARQYVFGGTAKTGGSDQTERGTATGEGYHRGP